jgi:hypothetical protein
VGLAVDDDGELAEVGYIGAVAVDEAMEDQAAGVGCGESFQLPVVAPVWRPTLVDVPRLGEDVGVQAAAGRVRDEVAAFVAGLGEGWR